MTKLAFTVDEFCQQHGIGRATFYNLRRDGRGPKVIKLGGITSRSLISFEAAAEWRSRMENETEANSAREGARTEGADAAD
jgi:predicted DNA-binding transcriptional regulator AlpA